MLQPFYVSVDFKQKKTIIEPIVTQLDDLIFVVTVFDNGAPAIVDGTTYRFVSRRPDNKSYYAEGVKTGENEITFDLGKPEVSLVGSVEAAIQIFDESMQRLSSFTFKYTVVEDISLSEEITSQELTLLEMVIQDGPGLVDYFTQAKPLVEQYTDYVNDLNGLQNQIDKHDSELNEGAILVSSFKTSDNSWNDAINSAINMSNRKTIKLPPQTIWLSSTVYIPSGFRVLGVKGETWVTTNVSMTAAFMCNTNISDVHFDGVGFLGGVLDTGQQVPTRARTTGVSFSHGIRFEGSLMPDQTTNPVINNISVTNCIFKNIASLPIWLGGIGGFVRVFDNEFDNNLDVGFVYDKNVFFSRNKVSRSADNGVSISRGNENVVCNSNIIEISSYAGIWLAGWQGGTGNTGAGPSKFTCIGNIINDSGWCAIDLEDAPKNGIVSGNIIDGVRRGPVDGIDDSRGFAISVKPFSSNMYPVTQSNVVEFARNLKIDDNIIMNASRGGIYIRGLLIGQIKNNTLLNIGSVTYGDGITSIPPTTTENFGILLDLQGGDTIQDVDIEGNKIIDNRSATMSDGTRITNFPIAMGYNTRIRVKDNSVYGTQQKLTDGLKQNDAMTNNLESLIMAKASSNTGANTTSFVSADVEGYYRMGILKKSGINPYIATASGIPFEIWRLSATSVLDPSATSEKLFRVDKDPSSNKPAIWIGASDNMIREEDLATGVTGLRTEKKFTAAGGLKSQSAWNGGHLEMGGYHMWWDASNKLRYKSTAAPTSDTDGAVLAGQTSLSISSIPLYIGQIAVVGSIGYLAVGTSSTSDWKQITN